MHCCACSGVCYHDGGPYYCPQHWPRYSPPTTGTVKTTIIPPAVTLTDEQMEQIAEKVAEKLRGSE